MQTKRLTKFHHKMNLSFYMEPPNTLLHSVLQDQSSPKITIININDSKFYQMISKTNSLNLLNKIENYLNSSYDDNNSKESYMKLATLLFDVISFTSNPPFDKNDYLKALEYQCILIEKMINSVQHNLAVVERQEQKVAYVPQQNSNVASTPEQLKQFKELLDAGVITQEEFDAKKKQILGL